MQNITAKIAMQPMHAYEVNNYPNKHINNLRQHGLHLTEAFSSRRYYYILKFTVVPHTMIKNIIIFIT